MHFRAGRPKWRKILEKFWGWGECSLYLVRYNVGVGSLDALVCHGGWGCFSWAWMVTLPLAHYHGARKASAASVQPPAIAAPSPLP